MEPEDFPTTMDITVHHCLMEAVLGQLLMVVNDVLDQEHIEQSFWDTVFQKWQPTKKHRGVGNSRSNLHRQQQQRNLLVESASSKSQTSIKTFFHVQQDTFDAAETVVEEHDNNDGNMSDETEDHKDSVPRTKIKETDLLLSESFRRITEMTLKVKQSRSILLEISS